MQHCDKHNFEYEDFLEECPICYGEAIYPAINADYVPEDLTYVPPISLKQRRKANEIN